MSRGRVYYAKTYNRFRTAAKQELPAAVMAAGWGAPMRGPLVVAVTVSAPRPKSTVLDFPKPDVDNYAKAVLDSCNGWLWDDDEQIVELKISKRWANVGRIVITVERYEGDCT